MAAGPQCGFLLDHVYQIIWREGGSLRTTTALQTVPTQRLQPIHFAFSKMEPIYNSSSQYMRSPTPIALLRKCSPTLMQIIDFVHAEVAAGGELGTK